MRFDRVYSVLILDRVWTEFILDWVCTGFILDWVCAEFILDRVCTGFILDRVCTELILDRVCTESYSNEFILNSCSIVFANSFECGIILKKGIFAWLALLKINQESETLTLTVSKVRLLTVNSRLFINNGKVFDGINDTARELPAQVAMACKLSFTDVCT